FMRIKTSVVVLNLLCTCLCRLAFGTQADDTTITILGATGGSSPFLSQVSLTASDTSVIKSIQFTISPKPGSVTRPLSATYSNAYLTDRGDLLPGTGEIFLPVYGLYSGFTNTVNLTYYFLDGSKKGDSTTITTDVFADPCGYNSPTVLQARTTTTDLSYDYIFVHGLCYGYSPAIIDSDGALRWMAPVSADQAFPSGFFDNAIYFASGTSLYRIDLDGTMTSFGDYYPKLNVIDFNHNMDRGKSGIILDSNTTQDALCVFTEIDFAGNVLKTWDMADIISAAMIAGGDDPSQFVTPYPYDWFHGNAAVYNRADDSLIVSSRENFVICIDYDTGAIKWILGDPTKQWHQFASLAKYALDATPGTLYPIGQHGVSVAFDQKLLLFDNGLNSQHHDPPGENRDYSSPRKYSLDLENKLATEIWNYERDQSIYSGICGSIYEDSPLNYLITYSVVDTRYAQLLGLDAAGEQVFLYQYPTTSCSAAYNASQLHLENTSFPTIQSRPLNVSTRGSIAAGENSLIGGFIISGTDPKTVVLRALGPSLADAGVPEPATDPSLTLFDSSGVMVTSNDDWESDPGADQIRANGLGPQDPAEAATIQTLAPGAYSFVCTQKDATPGIGLVEAYDLSPLANSTLANISTRGTVGTGDNVLIAGFIVGQVEKDTVVIRGLGPSLASSGIAAPLSDPFLTVYDGNGEVLATNDNWGGDYSAQQMTDRGLAPVDEMEAATILHLAPGAYSAILSGSSGSTGVGLIEIYSLN
ncbi:MAG TPA: aryl-sulfate sulfotransferase, partial [Candidatus Binataceae bacterium]|nr:aryl-sulfate sulfotransferase [Candidatus Binataceae bacterium]